MFRKFLFCICAIFILTVATTLDAGCNSYPNSFPSYIGGQAVCAGTGPGCTECVEGSGSCVTNGISCSPGPFQQT